MNLSGNQLSGPIPPQLGNLTRLQFLFLYQNHLTGPIPAALGNLTSLGSLQLYDNDLSGTIPPQLGNLTLLDGLNLSDNQLTGMIPAELGNLNNLAHLNLDTDTGLCLAQDFPLTSPFATLAGLSVCTTGGGGGSTRTVPGAPRNLVADGRDEQVTLTWDAPENNGDDAVTDYEVRITGGPWTSIGSTNTTYTVTGLVNGTVYGFEVRAVNAAGSGASSNLAEATPMAEEVFTLNFAHFANGDGITSDLVFVNLSTQRSGPALSPFHQAVPPIRPAILLLR